MGREEGRYRAADGAGVGDVDGAVVGREGDAVGLVDAVFDDVDGASAGTEAVGGGFQLRGCVG